MTTHLNKLTCCWKFHCPWTMFLRCSVHNFKIASLGNVKKLNVEFEIQIPIYYFNGFSNENKMAKNHLTCASFGSNVASWDAYHGQSQTNKYFSQILYTIFAWIALCLTSKTMFLIADVHQQSGIITFRGKIKKMYYQVNNKITRIWFCQRSW